MITCLRCGCAVPLPDSEPVREERKINRLLAKRQKVVHLNQYLVSARARIWDGQHAPTVYHNTAESDMIIALEGLYNLIRTDLNHDLQRVGLKPLLIKRGGICE